MHHRFGFNERISFEASNDEESKGNARFSLANTTFIKSGKISPASTVKQLQEPAAPKLSTIDEPDAPSMSYTNSNESI